MIILTLRTDKPESELALYDAETCLGELKWEAHRQLAETLHQQIKDFLQSYNKIFDDLGGIVVYKGPGSFTGLRIGLSVANALAYSFGAPITGQHGDEWQLTGVRVLLARKGSKVALPDYGGSVFVTAPKK